MRVCDRAPRIAVVTLSDGTRVRTHARTHALAARGGARGSGEEEHFGDEDRKGDEFIVFWKELAITGSNMQ